MKKTLSTKVEDLVALRQEQLRSIVKNDLQGLGKRDGMEVFSWPNPHFDKLSTMLCSFPFPVIWIGRHEQIRCTATYYPETVEHIEAALIYDSAEINFKEELLAKIKTILATGSLESAMKLRENWIGQQMVLLFSTEGEEASSDLAHFEKLVG